MSAFDVNIPMLLSDVSFLVNPGRRNFAIQTTATRASYRCCRSYPGVIEEGH